MKSPAFQFYPSDFLAVIATLKLEEIGAYSTLLSYDWQLNGLPVEPEKLARLLRISRRKFDAIWSVIGDHFPEADGRRHNPGLQLERAKQAEWREKSRKGGVKSGEARAKGGSRVVDEWHQPNANTTSSTSSAVTATAKPTTAPRKAAVSVSDDDPRFAALWAIYPRRSGGNSRADAFAAFRARIAAGVDPTAMHAGVERYAAYIRSKGQEGSSYVKQTKTFLGPGEHWLDQFDAAPHAAGPTQAAGGDDAAWEAALEVVGRMVRREITAESFAEIPAAVRAGLRALGGWTAIRDAKATDLPFRRRDFLAAYRAAQSTVTAGAA